MEHLVELAKEGNQEAIGELYRLNKPFIYHYILKRVNNPEEAEDLTSKVFLRAIEKLDQYNYQKGAGYPNWLTRIAHNIIIDEWRKNNRLVVWNEIPEHMFGEDLSAEDDVMQREDDLNYFLDLCTPQQAKVIRLKYQDDMSNEQIADILGTTVGAVKSMQHRAFDNIRDSIAIM